MRFATLSSQPEIDAQLRRCKPRTAQAPALPWLPALCGVALVAIMQTLL